MSRLWIVVSVAMVALAGPFTGPASAQDCEKVLVPDVAYTQMDITTSLSYMSVITASNFERHKAAASAGLSIPIAEALLKASATYDEYSQKRQESYKSYQFSYDSIDLSTYYQRRLPEALANAFVECTKAFGFKARVQRADEEYVEVVVGWRPAAGAPQTVKFSPAFVGGGQLKSSLPKELKYSEDFTLTFQRTAEQTFRFNANVGGTTQSVIVPKFVKVPVIPTLAERIQRSQKFRVVFDKLNQPIGTIKPQAILFGYYRPADEEWEVWSKQHPAKPDFHFIYGFPGGGTVGKLAAPTRPANMTVNLWGVTFSFTNDGRIYHPTNKSLVVGEIRITD